MDPGGWTRVLLLLFVTANTRASFSRHMDDFVEAVRRVEDAAPELGPAAVLRTLRRAAGLSDAMTHRFLGRMDSAAEVEAGLSRYIRTAVRHGVTADGAEEGVLLTPDGTTVALRPLLLGIEAGLLSRSAGSVRGLYQLCLAQDLSLALSSGASLGPDGCWDSVASPGVFTLSGAPSPLTAAQVNGGMDGVLLGLEVSDQARRPLKLSGLLSEYYGQRLDAGGLDAAPRLISRRRRDNFRGLPLGPELHRQVMRVVALQRRLEGRPKMEATEKKQLKEGVRAFGHQYVDCPPVVPRCMWGAEPYRGTPTNLSLPLSFLYVHHTHAPGRPCLTFEQCSADMRSMQRFHQDERGWDDIGYSFVAGSDGYVYEGRGWHRQGAHTLGHNAKGYGVAFIGDYAAELPSRHSMGLVRDQLASCAVGGGRLVADYTLQGHRQVVSTSCPGDALYSEITRWKHWGEAKKKKV